jgi:hypothetical protein
VTLVVHADPNYFVTQRYYSPYPLKEIENELEEAVLPPELSAAYSKHQASTATSRAGGGRSRMRASDLFAGVMNRPAGAELPNLYVCDRCLKYFSEGITWEKHQVSDLHSCLGRFTDGS